MASLKYGTQYYYLVNIINAYNYYDFIKISIARLMQNKLLSRESDDKIKST